MAAMTLTGCMEMSSFTFQITVMEEKQDNAPMSEQGMRDYLWALIESKGTLAVLNIVRDY
jgi:hypothetical protein